jgi:beta-lactam-binding protein with PASTA domain
LKKLYNPLYAVALWLVLGAFGFLTFDKIVMPIWAGRYKERIETPKVETLAGKKAEEVLVEEGLNFYWMPEAKFSATVPKGHVLSQVPAAGREVKEGRTVVLTVSKGLREIQIPGFRGKSKRQAEIALQQMGLTKGKFLKSKHATIPRGVVIRSVPNQEEWVKVGSTVDLVISSGVGSGIYLPNFIGRSMESAKGKIDSLGFVVSIEEVQDEKKDVLPNTVLNQIPLGGEYLKEGEKVVLKVYK